MNLSPGKICRIHIRFLWLEIRNVISNVMNSIVSHFPKQPINFIHFTLQIRASTGRFNVDDVYRLPWHQDIGSSHISMQHLHTMNLKVRILYFVFNRGTDLLFWRRYTLKWSANKHSSVHLDVFENDYMAESDSAESNEFRDTDSP